MRRFKVKYLDYYTPIQEISISDFINQIEETDIPLGLADKNEYLDIINSHFLLKSIRVENKFDKCEMIDLIMDRLFTLNIVEPKDIDLVIVAQEDIEYNISKFIQKKYQLINSYSVNLSGNQCSNIDIALNIVNSIISNKQSLNNILIVNVAKINNLKDRIFGTYGILGDGAGLILLSRDEKGIDIVDSSIASNILIEEGFTINNMLNHTKYLKISLQNLLDRNNLNSKNIHKIIIQNANPLLVNNVIKSFDFDSDIIFYDNIGKYGHLGSLDLIVNLKDYLKNKENHQNIISTTLGSNGSYVSTYFRV